MGLSAIVIKYCLDYDSEFGWAESLMLGSVLAATDPVAVVALLKEVGAS
jgi:NhaP-type Na+/H+ or K+/H+ antiporter